MPERAEEVDEVVEEDTEEVIQTSSSTADEIERLFTEVNDFAKDLSKRLSVYGITLASTTAGITKNQDEVKKAVTPIDSKTASVLLKDLSTMASLYDNYTRQTGLIFPAKS